MASLYRQEKKIATPLALLLLVAVLITTAVSIQKIKTAATRAQTNAIAGAEVTNITENSASIVWRTTQKTIGWVTYGEDKNNLENVGLDDRDASTQKHSSTLHHVTIKNLKANTTYFFTITNNTALLFFKTAPTAAVQNSIKPAFGKALHKNGTPLAEGLVILKIDNAVSLSSLTARTGEWLIPLYYLHNKTTNKPLRATAETPVIIEVYNDLQEQASAVTTISHISPLPQTIVIGQKYEFKEEKINVLAGKNDNSDSSRTTNTIDIIFPKELAIIPGRRPLIKGTAPPLTDVTITIRTTSAKPLISTATVTSNADGIWSFIPTVQLAEEAHTVTATSIDATGRTLTQTRVFSIAKSGESILGEATPAATITAVPTSPAPSAVPQPTSAPTAIPTPPVTGISDIAVPLIGTGLLLLGAGFLFLW